MTSAQEKNVFGHVQVSQSHDYLVPEIIRLMKAINPQDRKLRVLDNGCGKGSITYQIQKIGHDAIGIEPSEDGREIGSQQFPSVKILNRSGYDDLRSELGTFDVVTSIEVIEHLYNPVLYLTNIRKILNKDGFLILSTPFHGYLKNLALAATGKLESHFQATRVHGHIKFFSKNSLEKILQDTGFNRIVFSHAGRVGPLAKSMFVIARPDPAFKDD